VEAAMKTTIELLDALNDAEYVQINGTLFETEYWRLPDEDTVAEDILLEAKSGDTELSFTRDDLADAQYVGQGIYRLKSGLHLRFLTPTTIH
jgi:hypothetical protein